MQAVCSVGVVSSRHFMHRHGYEGLRAQAKEIFERNSLIHCPYFGTDVVLNASRPTPARASSSSSLVSVLARSARLARGGTTPNTSQKPTAKQRLNPRPPARVANQNP